MDFLMELVQQILPVLIVFLVGYFGKKYLDKETLAVILALVQKIIIETEKQFPEKTGEERKRIVIEKIEEQLPKKEKTLLNKAMNGIGNAVEFVFQTTAQNILFKKLKGK